MAITSRDNAVFEAGIKLGALYHQFVGSPVSPTTVDSLEKAISQSISVQPYVKNIKVVIDRQMLMESLNTFGYAELKGTMLHVDAVFEYNRIEVKASMELKNGYPLMYIKDIKVLSEE